MNISWMMSVYATEYSPPSTVYARAITADMIIAIQVGKPIITASDDPVVWKSELIFIMSVNQLSDIQVQTWLSYVYRYMMGCHKGPVFPCFG